MTSPTNIRTYNGAMLEGSSDVTNVTARMSDSDLSARAATCNVVHMTSTETTTPTTTETTTLGSTTVAAIEAAWAAIVARHPEVPADVVIITGMGQVRGGVVRGHYRPSTWVVQGGEDRKHEVFLSGERMADGGRAMMTTLVHEAVHALAQARGIKDTSRQNRYHNGKFAELATEMGLVPPAAPDLTLGFSDCVMPDETAEAYAEVIERLDGEVEVGIPTISTADLYAWANVIGYVLGAWSVFVGWYGQGQPEAMWGMLGGKVRRPRAPRQPRTTTVACSCTEVSVPVAAAAALQGFVCPSCGEALA